MFRSTSLIVAACLLAGSVLSQDLAALVGNMSPACQAAAGAIATSDFGTCANVMGLIPTLGSAGSVLAPLNTWVDSICSTSPCSNATVSSALSKITTGCEADLQKGVTGAVAISSIIRNYSPIHDSLCLQDANKARCANSLLLSVEKSINRPLSIPEVETFLVSGFTALTPLLANFSKESYCTDCNHALATTLPNAKTAAPTGNHTAAANTTGHAGHDGLAALAAACGPQFIDGKIPSTVSAGGSAASSGPSKTTAAGNAANSAASIAHSNAFSLAVGLGFVVMAPFALL